MEPKIRLKGFCGEWKNNKLQNCADFLDCQRMPVKADKRGKNRGLYPYYGASGIVDYIDNYIFDGEYVLLSEDGANIIDRNYRVAFIAKGKIWVNNHAHVLVPKENTCLEFLAEVLERKDYSLYNTGTTMPKLNQEICRNIEISVPSLPEQLALATFFTSLDNQISAAEKRLASLKQVKAASLQAMFPQEGETTPKLRFKGCEGEWKKVKLGDVALVNPKSELPESFEYVDLESVIGTSMIAHRRETKGSAPSRAQRLAQTDDIFYQTVRPYQRNNYHFMKNESDYVFSSGYAQLRSIKDANFLFTIIQSDFFLKQVMDNCTGSSFPAINPSSLKELIVHDCDRNEQKLIGDFFTSLDRQITAQSSKISKLKQIKSACLDQMFV